MLAQKVLAGKTRGYRHHPQLIRFQSQSRPLDSIGAFLRGLLDEAHRRGYRFDATKILSTKPVRRLAETEGQLLFEWEHLRSKLRVRSPLIFRHHQTIPRPEPHPLFRLVPGGGRDWGKR